MSLELSTPFIFTVCQVGAESALKKEMARQNPEYRFAFSRPGYVTFKNIQGPVSLDFSIHSVFARTYGLSFGTFEHTEISKVFELGVSLLAQDPLRKVRLHLWERDQTISGKEPLGFKEGLLLGDLESMLRKHDQKEFGRIFNIDPHPQVGDWILQIVALDGKKFGLGALLHSQLNSPWPGGKPKINLPAESPSRAYLKLENSVLWFNPPFRTGDVAVEIGSSPGGASYALLNRGLKVIGIDPAAMDLRVLKYPNFKHIQEPVGQVLREDLPPSVQWLLLDMNVEPNISLCAVDRLASRMKDSLLGMILTVKLNQWKFADEIPYFVEYTKAMGLVKVRAAQLAYHRQEIVICGLTRLGNVRPRV